MEFVRHNRRNITLRAAFIVAFFASFFVHAQNAINPFDSGLIDLRSPVSKPFQSYCPLNFNTDDDSLCVTPTIKPTDSASNAAQSYASYVSTLYTNITSYDVIPDSPGTYKIHLKKINFHGVEYVDQYLSVTPKIKNTSVLRCPPDDFPDHQSTHYTSETEFKCYRASDLQAYYDDIADANEADNNCANLILDSGNNNGAVMCYTSPTGNSCNVEMVQGAGYDYYIGTGSNPSGCANSENPPFDNAGIGDENDSCITSNGTDFCSAEKAKHCTSSNGVETCDSGCIEINGNFMCDPSKHPDVGEGDSDYFDSKGTCSVVAGSAYKGACEELGGTWDKSGDYTETSCPPTSISGTCSVGTNGGCFACLDAGGTWEPDPNAPLNNTEKGIQDVAALTQKTNDALKVLELTGRKGTESLISTIKTGNQTLIGEIKTLTGTGSGGVGGLGQKLDEIKDELEKETFTTTTGNIDKSLINGLFDSQKIAAVKANQEVIKTEIQTFINTSRSELSNMLKINAPASTGYQARTVTLFGHTIDLSLNRFSDFFSMLAAPILFVCSIFALFIMLGRD